MKTLKISATCILLAFLCLFTSIGYAAISAPMKVSGSAKIDIPYGLFITQVITKETSYVDSNYVEFLPHSTTVDSIINRANRAGTVKYEITVFNNTSLTYSYRDIYYQTNLNNYNGNQHVTTETRNVNSKISVVCSLKNASAEAKKVEPGRSLTFTVTYTVGTGRSSGTDWRTLINFQFGINVDGEREALAVVEEKFLNILNTTSTYKQLTDVLDNKFDGRQEWTSNYIGNVNGSSSEDSVAVNTLFAGQLQITVGKDELDATVMIKHENLDGNNYTGDDYVAEHTNGGIFRGYGCEMTLYLTVDPLEDRNAYVPVYVVVFTCDRDLNGNKTSDWYRIGSTYAGTANVVAYNGSEGTGSFVTDHWRANATNYKLIDGYSFAIKGETYRLDSYSQSIAEGVSIKDIVIETDINATNTFKKLLDDARRLASNQAYAGTGINLVSECYEKYASLASVDENGNHTVSADLSIAQLSPAILDLYNVINDALIQIDEKIN